MSSDTNKLNETEIICPSEFSLDENYIYNDSNEKSLKESRHAPINKPNILLNVLKDFSVKYDLDDKKIMKSKKFILSFNDLISLIKFALEFQNKISNSLNVKDYLNEISQDFINNLSYYIFSYEKIDINQNNNNYINYNIYNNNLNNKKNKKQIKNDEDNISTKKNRNENIPSTKSYFKTNNNNNNKKILSQKYNDNINNKKDDKNKLNKSAERRKNVYLNEFENSNIEENNNKKRINKSTDKRRIKNENNVYGEKKSNISIFSACENLKGSNLLKNTHSRRISCTETNKNNNNLNMNYNTTKNKSDKVVFYDQNLNLGIGVKKQVITNNIIRPSNMANKLLQKGMKYITEFKDIKEEESKKKY